MGKEEKRKREKEGKLLVKGNREEGGTTKK